MSALPSTEDLARLAKAITPGPWRRDLENMVCNQRFRSHLLARRYRIPGHLGSGLCSYLDLAEYISASFARRASLDMMSVDRTPGSSK